jgi:hypothetical protein
MSLCLKHTENLIKTKHNSQKGKRQGNLDREMKESGQRKGEI